MRRKAPPTGIGIALFLFFAGVLPAHAIRITQVDGKFDCPDLFNQQECAWRFSKPFLATHADLVRTDGQVLTVTLRNGSQIQLIGLHDPMELDQSGRFLAVREQFGEGNSWHLVDLDLGTTTEIYGYPLFSPDGSRFICTSEDLDAGYSPNVFDLYEVTPDGVTTVYTADIPDIFPWAARNVRWTDNEHVAFRRTSFNIEYLNTPTGFDGGDHYIEVPSVLAHSNGVWEISEEQ